MPKSPYQDVLELKSEDGTIFKVEKFYLMASSAVFRDMLTSFPAASVGTGKGEKPGQGQSQNDVNAEEVAPIDIPALSGYLALFVELVKQSPLPSLDDFKDSVEIGGSGQPRASPIDHLESILSLLDRFECSLAIQERVFPWFESDFTEDPWTVFCLAAKYNNVGIGRQALIAAGYCEKELRYRMRAAALSIEDASKVPLKWLMGFFRAYYNTEIYKKHDKSLDQDRQFWAGVASRFTIEK